jgi:hypothetical protein
LWRTSFRGEASAGAYGLGPVPQNAVVDRVAAGTREPNAAATLLLWRTWYGKEDAGARPVAREPVATGPVIWNLQPAGRIADAALVPAQGIRADLAAGAVAANVGTQNPLLPDFEEVATPQARIQLEPPGTLRVFRLESEEALQERIRQEARGPGAAPIYFPEEQPVRWEPKPDHGGPPKQMLVEPQYVCYGRLMFEQRYSERYGWDVGFMQPLVCAGSFYYDVGTAPFRRLLIEPCRSFECSAGYCLPGDPVPWLLGPPELIPCGFGANGGQCQAGCEKP